MTGLLDAFSVLSRVSPPAKPQYLKSFLPETGRSFPDITPAVMSELYPDTTPQHTGHPLPQIDPMKSTAGQQPDIKPLTHTGGVGLQMPALRHTGGAQPNIEPLKHTGGVMPDTSVKPYRTMSEEKKPLTAQEAVKQGMSAEEYATNEAKWFHGSGSEIKKFDDKHLGEGTEAVNSQMGVFFTDSKLQAELYSGKKGSLNPSKIDLKNPLEVISSMKFDTDASRMLNELISDYSGKPISEIDTNDVTEYRDFLKSQGYDGIIVTLKHSNKKNVVVFDPSQIKTKSQLLSEYEQAKQTAPAEGGSAQPPAPKKLIGLATIGQKKARKVK